MDANQFDSLSKRVSTPSTRRATLGAMVASVFGLAGAPPVARAAPGQTCTMAFVAAVRVGPSVNTTLVPGAPQPGQLQGKLSFTLNESGKLENASLTLPNNKSLPVVGQAIGNSLQMRIVVDGSVAVVAMGVGEADIADCKGAVDGTTAGPQIGDLGEWHARGQGLTGQPTANAGGKKGGKGGAAGAVAGAGNAQARGSKGGGQGGGGGGNGGGGAKGGGGNGGGGGGSKGGGQGGATSPTGPAGTPPKCTTGQTLCGNVCVDVKTDKANCGQCGNKCKKNATCVAGTCTATAEQGVVCPDGQTDCAGVCVKLNNDQNNCGKCGNACGALDCVDSVCGGSCPADRPDDCGDCVATQTDPKNCGGCGAVCPVGEKCVAGICSGGDLGIVCPAEKPDNCGGVCVFLLNDDNNCGTCGTSCNGADCVNGVCGGTCPPATPDDCGVCVDTQNDAKNCGGCFAVCPAGETCVAGACSGGGGGVANCPPEKPDSCAGVCVFLLNDDDNCGACGNSCNGGDCVNGVCGGTCPPATPDDCGVCVDTQNDPNNCGGCFAVCPAGETCTAGACSGGGGGANLMPNCPPATPDNCAGVCTNATTDPKNCGVCGFACLAGETCTGGFCVGQAAAAPVDCAGQGLDQCNGVCVNFKTDPSNCGACGASCAPGEACVDEGCHAPAAGDGAVPVICPAGQTNCGGICTDATSDPSNCGGCGTVCVAGSTCTGGFCVAPAAPAQAARVEQDCASQGLTDCGGGFCADTANDPANCGGCGVFCAAGETCGGGFCIGLAAPAQDVPVALDCAGQGLTDCGGFCADVSSDSSNCGGCGNFCADGTSCGGGICI